MATWNPFSKTGKDRFLEVEEAAKRFLGMEAAIKMAIVKTWRLTKGGESVIAIGKITNVDTSNDLPIYNAESVAGPNLNVVNAIPINRILADSKIIPAEVDDTCLLVKRPADPDAPPGTPEPETELIILTEEGEFGECPPPPGLVNAQDAGGSSGQGGNGVGIANSVVTQDYSHAEMFDYFYTLVQQRTGTPTIASGTSTSGAGATVASITAGTGKKFVNWICTTAQSATANTQLTITVTYSDTTTMTATTIASRDDHMTAHAGGIINGTSTPTIVAGSATKHVTAISVVCAGSGTGTRAAVITAYEAFL